MTATPENRRRGLSFGMVIGRERRARCLCVQEKTTGAWPSRFDPEK
jgi:hypothetical protein